MVTVNIPIKGGEAGEGKLVISAPGFEGAEVTVKVFSMIYRNYV